MVRQALGVELAAVEPDEANPSESEYTIDQLRLEYPLLGKVGRNSFGKSSRAIAGVVLLFGSRRQTVKWTVVYRLYRAGEQFQWQ